MLVKRSIKQLAAYFSNRRPRINRIEDSATRWRILHVEYICCAPNQNTKHASGQPDGGRSLCTHLPPHYPPPQLRTLTWLFRHRTGTHRPANRRRTRTSHSHTPRRSCSCPARTRSIWAPWPRPRLPRQPTRRRLRWRETPAIRRGRRQSSIAAPHWSGGCQLVSDGILPWTRTVPAESLRMRPTFDLRLDLASNTLSCLLLLQLVQWFSFVWLLVAQLPDRPCSLFVRSGCPPV